MRLAVIATHPVQYYAPLFRLLAERLELTVYYAHVPNPTEQGGGFGTAFAWDIDLTSGYDYKVLKNISARPDVSRAAGLDTPEIAEQLANGCFDVVLALGWYTRSLRQGIIAAKRLGIPVMVRGDSQVGLTANPLQRLAKDALYPFLLRTFNAALTVGTRNSEFFRRYHYPASRLFHSPHAVDTARFAATGTPRAGAALRSKNEIGADERVVLFTGKLVDFKRPLVAVDAVAKLNANGLQTRLMIAGAGPLEGAVRERADSAGIALTQLGFVNQSEIPAVYAAADALVLPSTSRETWGLVANEALACGTPVVVSHEAGCSPDLCDGRAGIACDGGDPTAVAVAISELLENRSQNREAIAEMSAAHSLARAVDGIVAGAMALLNK